MLIPKIVTAVAVSVCLLVPSLSTARYIIKLKNGREIFTERYWNEGSKVMFERDSGVLGVNKDQVVEIKEEAKPKGVEVEYTGPRDTTPAAPATAPAGATTPPAAESTPPAASPEKAPAQAAADAPKSKEKIDEAYYRQKRQEIINKINAFVEERSQATQNQDAAGKQAAREGYLQAAQELYALQEELKKKNGGELPPWWEKM